ncbi:hypothetical protein [Azonexus sp.]|uniref:hypothetical protein n=1 Tax=Azonexus sp. TaxID=1872668 RepID=UPI0027BAA31C|nr:hypothetical protein [Azonexus sp.]
MKLFKFSVGALMLASAAAASADVSCNKSYAFRADVNNTVGHTICDSSAETFLDTLSNFKASNLNYTDISQATVAGRFSDVSLNLAYSANSTTLHYNFVELGESGSFTGATRKESEDQFEDFIKKKGIIGRIMNYEAKHSPTSPITGAGGMIPMTIAADFGASFNQSPTSGAGAAASGSANNNLIGASINYGSYKVSGRGDDITTTSIPLSYTIRNGIDPRRQLNISVPITLVQVGDAKTAHAGLGVSYRLPMSDQWTLTPGVRYSVVASADRATVASVYSASLASTYVIPLNSFDVTIGNMVGYYTTGKISAGDYSFNPDIKNIAVRNGVMLSQPVNIGRKLTAEYSLIDTRYLGSDKPFLDNYQEIGITLGTNKSAMDARSFVRGGLTFMQGPKTSGVTANLGYWF